MGATRRTFTGAAFAAAALSAGGGALAQERVVRVGDTAALALSWPLFIAEAKGFFRAEGLKVETTYTNSNPAVAQQVVGGNFDIGSTTYETGVRAIMGGAPIKLVASMMRAFPYVVMADAGVKTPADLRKKRVVLTLAKSVLTVFWNRWLKENGVAPDDVDQVYDPATPNRFAALQSKAVEAAVLSQPFDWIAAEKGFNKIFDLGAYAKGFGFTAFVAREDWLAKNPDTAKAFFRAVSKAVVWFDTPANSAEAAAILAAATKMEPANAARLYDYYTKELKPFDKSLDLPEKQLSLLIGTLVEMGDFKANDDYRLTRFVNPSYLPV